MTRIVRVSNPQSPATPRGAVKGAKSGSWHDPSQLTRSTVKTRTPVRILHVTDPTRNTFSPGMEQFTNNANPRFDPSKAPGSVRRLDGTPPPPRGSANTGHQKVIRYSSYIQTGGKTLKRKQF